MQIRLIHTDSSPTITLAQDPVLMLADVCYEMFSRRELKKPREILPELQAAFPEIPEEQQLKALQLALSWKRMMRGAARLPQ